MRVQTGLVAALVIAVTLLVSGTLMLCGLGRSMIRGAEEEQAQRAAEAAGLVSTSGPDSLNDPQAAYLTSEGLLQVVDEAGAVVWTSNPHRLQAADPILLGPGQADRVTDWTPFGEGEGHTVAGNGAVHAGRNYTVLADMPLHWVDNVLRRDAFSILMGAPVLAVLGGVVVSAVVGRTLRPVEEIRTAAESISARSLATRVPVPRGDDEVSRLAVTMNQMLDRLDESHTSQRRFVADASHELRSPVAAISAGLELIRTDPQVIPKVLPVLEEETTRLVGLNDGLLVLARSDVGRVHGHEEEIDLDDVVGSEVRRLRTFPSLQVSARLVPARLFGDREAIERAVRNLVDNARNYTASRVGLSMDLVPAPQDGHTPDERHFAVVRVDDDGPGIAEEHREKIFGRFVRLEESRARRPGGAGLGLALVEAAARAHGGDVHVEESPWGGARFMLRLPAGEQPVPAEDEDADYSE